MEASNEPSVRLNTTERARQTDSRTVYTHLHNTRTETFKSPDPTFEKDKFRSYLELVQLLFDGLHLGTDHALAVQALLYSSQEALQLGHQTVELTHLLSRVVDLVQLGLASLTQLEVRNSGRGRDALSNVMIIGEHPVKLGEYWAITGKHPRENGRNTMLHVFFLELGSELDLF